MVLLERRIFENPIVQKAVDFGAENFDVLRVGVVGMPSVKKSIGRWIS